MTSSPAKVSFQVRIALLLLAFLGTASSYGEERCLSQIPSFPTENQAIMTVSDLCISAYEAFIDGHPAVKEALGTMSRSERGVFRELLDSLNHKGSLPRLRLPNPPLSKEQLRLLYLRRAAIVIWNEVNKRVPWSITGYSREQLELLLSYSSIERWRGLDMVADMDVLLQDRRWIKSTSRQTVVAMNEWIRNNVVHRRDKVDPIAPESTQGALEGGSWGTCENVSDFLVIWSTALNIPARAFTSPGGHTAVDFPSEGTLLIHGDDLYAANYRVFPVDEIFIKGAARDSFLSAARSNPNDMDRQRALAPLRFLLSHAPTRSRAYASCRSEASFMERLNREFAAGDHRPEYMKYEKDALQLIHEAYLAIRKYAVEGGICVEARNYPFG